MTAGPRAMPRAEAARLLGVPQDAGPAEVQRAFQRAARLVHPDTRTGAEDVDRPSAGEALDRLLQARRTMLEDPPAGDPAVRPGEPDGPVFRRVEGRGLGGSLVVLALLAFLLVAIVTVQQGMQPDPFATPGSTPPAASGAP